jgi:hypothetical protein
MSPVGHRQATSAEQGRHERSIVRWRLHEISEGRCILFRQVRIVHEAYAQTPAVTEHITPLAGIRSFHGAKMGPTSQTN